MSLLPHRFKFKLGFTMVELLIVITIIGIISALGVTNYARTSKQARDASRRSSVKAIQDAMEQFYAVNNTYNNGCTAGNLSTYLPAGMPRDPGSGSITCTVTGGGTGYCAMANPMEITGAGTCDASCNAQVGGPAFCLRNLQ